MMGIKHDRQESYFTAHNKNDQNYNIDNKKVLYVYSEISNIENLLNMKTIYNKKLIGNIDNINSQFIAGWCAFIEENIFYILIDIFVNDQYYDTTVASRFRKDLLINLKGRVNGYNGFWYKFKSQLKNQDKVEISVRGNKFKFKNSTKIIIDE